VQADDLLVMRQLRANRVVGADEADDLEDDLGQVTGLQNDDSKQGLQLNRLRQLTGLSDPVYAEAYVQVHVYDIVLDVLVINQTPDTLQNLCLELATLGDLKLCERPRNYNLGPFDSKRIRANIKVSSTETGIIFGNIVYDVAGQATTLNADKNCVILNDIHIDIMDYISPAQCTHVDFRNMWSEFEWENKVVVNTEIRDVNEYLEHIMKVTNMGCLTPKKALEGECGFISANLYAKSVFGEDALANLSIERQPETGKIEGSIRIRSKKQGIALSLGDKITSSQRTNKTKEEVKAWLK
jgi:coatomer subunit beta